MKKIVAVIFVILLVFVGCSPVEDFQYVRANSDVDIFSEFDIFGGKIDKIELTLNGEMYLHLSFADSGQVVNSVKSINIEAVGEKAYDNNKRVLEISSSTKTNCIVYVKNVNDLLSGQMTYNSGTGFYSEHGKDYSSVEFTDRNGRKYDLQNLDDNQRVYTIKRFPSVDIKVSGGVVCSTSLGRQSINGSTLLYTTDEAVIVFAQDFSLLIILGVVFGSLLVAGIIVFVFKVRLFSRVRNKKQNTSEKK